MSGNELEICEMLVKNIDKIELGHLGKLHSIGAPNRSGPGYTPITIPEQLCMVSTEDSNKKADVYINGIGISIKKAGGSFSFNRLQIADLPDFYTQLGFANVDQLISQADNEVRKFHQGLLNRRNRPWQDFYTESEFAIVLEYLMMKGSPNKGISNHTASFILEAPPKCTSANAILVYTFQEYFNKYKENNIKISIRRQWVGQASKSEHGRASGLARKPGNAPWIFKDVAGKPRTGWQPKFPIESRRTTYFLMVEKVTGGSKTSIQPLPF